MSLFIIRSFFLSATIFAISVLAAVGISLLLYGNEWKEEQEDVEEYMTAQYTASLARMLQAGRIQKMLAAKDATVAEVQAILSSYMTTTYPTKDNVSQIAVPSKLLWTKESSLWFVLSQSLLIRYEDNLIERSFSTQILRFFIRFFGAIMNTIIVASMAGTLHLITDNILSIVIRLDKTHSKLSAEYQRRLVVRSTFITLVAFIYILLLLFGTAIIMKKDQDWILGNAVLSMVLAMTSNLHTKDLTPDFVVKENMTLIECVFFYCLHLVLYSAYGFFLFSVIRGFFIWRSSNHTIITNSECKQRLEDEQIERTNFLEFHTIRPHDKNA